METRGSRWFRGNRTIGILVRLPLLNNVPQLAVVRAGDMPEQSRPCSLSLNFLKGVSASLRVSTHGQRSGCVMGISWRSVNYSQVSGRRVGVGDSR